MKVMTFVFAFLFAGSMAFANSEMEDLKTQVSELSAKTGGNHLNLTPDLRTAVDRIDYTTMSGREVKQDSLFTNRFHLNMGWQYNKNMVFRGKLAYYKAFGDSGGHAQTNTQPGYGNFDWVVNENLYDNAVRVKEAYYLYLSDGLFGWNQLPWTFSVGRRPSTTGFLSNWREGDAEPSSPLGHVIDMEFDGASINFKLDKLVTVPGLSFKICLGRGLSNAKTRFQQDGLDYAPDGQYTKPMDFAGVILTPFDNGQYSLQTLYFKATNVIGFTPGMVQYMMTGGSSGSAPALTDVGGMTGGAVSFQVKGIGNMINDYLDQVKLFASYAFTKTDPATGMVMLGETEAKSGSSFWLGANLPVFFKGDSLGLEFNKGSKYWRSFTYGEDTLAGSKLATRGTALEAYYNVPLIDDAFVAQIRWTKMEYDYTGSMAFFGADGQPLTKDQILGYRQMGMNADAVEKSESIRLSLRYIY